jgi:hypothetical protein
VILPLRFAQTLGVGFTRKLSGLWTKRVIFYAFSIKKGALKGPTFLGVPLAIHSSLANEWRHN